MTQRRSVIVAGFGSIGRRHARLLMARGDLDVAVCDTSEEALADGFREMGTVPAHRSFEEALKTRPDIVVIATPHRLHADMTIQALQSGAHVLCEKPMCDSLVNGRRMLDAARKSDRLMGFGFQLHFHPGIQRLKNLVCSGRLGAIVHAHAHIGSHVTLLCSRSRHQAKVKGALLMDYAHQPDLLYWILGRKPQGVYMAATQAPMEPTSNPNVLGMVCDYDAPLISTIILNYVEHPERHEYHFTGDSGWVRWDGSAGRLWVGIRETKTIEEESFETVREPWYVDEYQAFLDAVDGKRSLESPPEDAMVSLEIIDAALRSWERGTRAALS